MNANRVALGVAAFMIAVEHPQAEATTELVRSERTLATSSDVICSGFIEDISYTRVVESHNFLVTVVQIRVDAWYFGGSKDGSGRVELVLPGGYEEDGSQVIVPGTPELQVGELVGVVGVVPRRTPWRVAALDFDRALLRAGEVPGSGEQWLLNGLGALVAGFGDESTLPVDSARTCPDSPDSLDSAGDCAGGTCDTVSGEMLAGDGLAPCGTLDQLDAVLLESLPWDEGVAFLRRVASQRSALAAPAVNVAPHPKVLPPSWRYHDL